MAQIKYKKYNLLLDPKDKEDAEIIELLDEIHDNKRKNSYSAIIKNALKLLKKERKNNRLVEE